MNYPKVRILADSINSLHKRVTTFEIEYWRAVHAELLTHKMLSRNSASSRAIPVSAVINQVRTDPAMPAHWGKNQSGMQAKELLTGDALEDAKESWLMIADIAASFSEDLAEIGCHKQIANRVTEPFQRIKVVVTATEWNNCWHLRDHEDAQPEIHDLFAEMRRQYNARDSLTYLRYGEWHLPYINISFSPDATIEYYDTENNRLTEQQALMISASLCAQVSYRKSDGTLEKAETIYDRLVNSKPVHASVFEHQAQCIDVTRVNPFSVNTWPEGLTHVDRDGKLWSGNLQGWIQHRQLIPDNYIKG